MNFGAEKMKVVSGILANLGQVCVASLVVPFVTGNVERIPVLAAGLFLATLFWSLSVAFIREETHL